MTITDPVEITEGTITAWVLTRDCKREWCGAPAGTEGFLKRSGSQDLAYCKGPDGGDEMHYAGWNAPRAETGRATKSLRTRADVAPSKRARILARDNSTCIVCHADDRPLDVGHLISLESGRELGLTDAELNDDENLGAMCAPCNSGLGREPVTLRFAVNLFRARLAHKHPRTPDGNASLFDG